MKLSDDFLLHFNPDRQKKTKSVHFLI